MKTLKKNGLEFYSVMERKYDAVRKGKKIAVYKKEYRWRIYRSGRIVGASSEGYTRLQGAVDNVYSIRHFLSLTELVNNAITAYKNRKK